MANIPERLSVSSFTQVDAEMIRAAGIDFDLFIVMFVMDHQPVLLGVIKTPSIIRQQPAIHHGIYRRRRTDEDFLVLYEE
jgi:hypothetical protein